MIFFLDDKRTTIMLDKTNDCIDDNLFVLVYGLIIIAMYLVTIVYISLSFENYAKYNKDRQIMKDAKYYEETFLYKFLKYIRGDGKGSIEAPMMDVLGKQKIPKEYDQYGIHEAHKTISINYTLMITFMSLIVLHFIFYLVVKYIVKSNICGLDFQLYGKVFFVALIPMIITIISTIEFYDKKFNQLLISLKFTNRKIANVNRILMKNITTDRSFLNALTMNDSLSLILILQQQTNEENLKRLLITQSIYSSIVNSIDASSSNIQDINDIFNDPNTKSSADLVPYLKIGLNLENILKEYQQNNSLGEVFRRIYPNESSRDNLINQLESRIDAILENITSEIGNLNTDFQENANKYMKGVLIFNVFMLLLVVIIIGALLKLMISPETFQWILTKLNDVFNKGSKLLILIIPIILIFILTK
uniref:Uncharacterized protein n=1 Tax=viral metagenome TaxID=1070528 RepID=A0A6C0CR05_9ZZZZ